ncbi:MAG: FkbM family methyltransferase [Gemmatales bacterium]|nr:FkbM family methyltransferase [Gemmatales bacterium]MDW8386028.1 FkbM family methyltransferase [Gemmatales bacterium]
MARRSGKLLTQRRRQKVEKDSLRRSSADKNLGPSRHCIRPSTRSSPLMPTTDLSNLCASGPRLDLVKIDAEGAEARVWEGMQQTLKRFPHAAVVLELHLQRDPPQAVGFLHEIERTGFALRLISYEGDVVPIGPDTIPARPQEHWSLWLQR